MLILARSRLPPRQLPLLAIYAYFIVYACEKQWIDREALGKAGAAVVGVLSMGEFIVPLRDSVLIFGSDWLAPIV